MVQVVDRLGLKFTLLNSQDEAAPEEQKAAVSRVLACVNGFVTDFPHLKPFGAHLAAVAREPFCRAPILRIYAATTTCFSRCRQTWQENLQPLLISLGHSTEAYSCLNEREQLFIIALEFCHARQFRRAFLTYIEILRRFPEDICAQLFLLNPFSFGVGKWAEVAAIYNEARDRNCWDAELLPAFMTWHCFVLDNAGLYGEANAQYEQLLKGGLQTSHAVHIGAHIKTFSHPIQEALSFLEESASTTRFFENGNRAHLLLHLGALYAFKLDFPSAIDIYDRMWHCEGVEIDQSKEEFQWNAILLLWYIELSAACTDLDAAGVDINFGERWAKLARVVDSSNERFLPVHGYYAVLYAFALHRGGFEQAAAAMVAQIKWQNMLLASGSKIRDTTSESVERSLACRQQLEHWRDVTLPLLQGCIAFADALGAHSRYNSDLCAKAIKAATILEAASAAAKTEKLGQSDEQLLVFRLSFLAAAALSVGVHARQQGSSLSWENCKSELLEAQSVRPLWPLESAWLCAGSAKQATSGGA